MGAQGTTEDRVGERKGGRETNEYGNPCWRHQEAYFRTLDIGAHQTFLEALDGVLCGVKIFSASKKTHEISAQAYWPFWPKIPGPVPTQSGTWPSRYPYSPPTTPRLVPVLPPGIHPTASGPPICQKTEQELSVGLLQVANGGTIPFLKGSEHGPAVAAMTALT